jgi:hypothetical protein
MMKRNSAPWFCTMLLLTISNMANAQGSKAAAEPHLAAAKAAAYEPGNDLTVLYDTVCAPALSEKVPVEPPDQGQASGSTSLANRKVPPREAWYTEPAKVFDNLYWLGSTQDSTWAVTTSEGIILIDSGLDYSAKELITDGLKKMGLDPAQRSNPLNMAVGGASTFNQSESQSGQNCLAPPRPRRQRFPEVYA